MNEYRPKPEGLGLTPIYIKLLTSFDPYSSSTTKKTDIT